VDEFPLTELDRKAEATLGDKAVLKSMAAATSFQRLPRYVSEYMVAKYVKRDSREKDIETVQEMIRTLMPEQDRKEHTQEKLLSEGQIVVMDNLDARVDLKSGKRWVYVPCIDDNNVRLNADIVKENTGIYDGMWGTATIRYAPESDSKAPNELTAFKPFQLNAPNLDEFRAFRGKFTTDEWMALVLQSAGYAANAFADRRTKLLLIARMLPLCEKNYNLIELGPRQTGKTFLLRNLSPRVFIISGGKTTPANLFLNLSTKQIGILGTRKVVVFDEVANADFADAGETISTLKDYMESGQFSRGSKGFTADAGLVFSGNLETKDGQPDPDYRGNFLRPLPVKLQDSAFHDRMTAYIPGWEIPKITNASIATGYGFVTDYFGEVLVRLRDDSFADRVNKVPLQGGLTRRDLRAIERSTSGLMKLLYPDGKATDEELLEMVTLACELRQRVHNQLVKLAPGEFKPKMIAPMSVKEHAAMDLKMAT
jgi:ATP-dependent Lon protease